MQAIVTGELVSHYGVSSYIRNILCILSTVSGI
jgi:hypothetical protein